MKKIYDIVPPDKAESVLKTKQITKEIKTKIKRKFSFRWIFIVLIALAGYGFFMDGSSEVIIYPKIEPVSGEEAITINLKQGTVDLENKIIPAIIFSSNESYSEDYGATGKTDKDITTKGIIRVYNKLNPSKPLTLIKGTRFLNETGELIYRATNGFTVPQAKTIDGKFTPGYVDVNVEADEAGEAYNINSGTFSVPGLNGTEYYSGIWAEIIDPLTGGYKSEVSVVLAKDLEIAENSFKEKFLAKNIEDLKNSIPDNYIFFEEDFSSEFENIVLGAKKGEEVASFSVSGIVKTEITAFRKEDIETILGKIIKEKTSEIKKIVPESLKYTFLESKPKEEGIELKTSFEGGIYWLPDNTFLLQSILGKDRDYSISLLENIPEIERAEINLTPFFKTKNTNNEDKVNIKLNFSQ